MPSVSTTGGSGALPAVTAKSSVSAGGNTSGLTVELNAGQRAHKSFYASVGGAATVIFEASVDGVEWRTISTVVTTGNLEILPDPGVLDTVRGFSHVRLRTPTTGIDATFELAAI